MAKLPISQQDVAQQIKSRANGLADELDWIGKLQSRIDASYQDESRRLKSLAPTDAETQRFHRRNFRHDCITSIGAIVALAAFFAICYWMR